MIKKIIFSSALILSLTTHHAVCVEEDDKPTILAKLADLGKKHEKEVKKNAELTNKRGYVQHYHIPERGGVDIEYASAPAGCDSLIQSNARLVEIYAKKKQLKTLLEKAE
ncbi:MAG: hypothetical protein K2X02_09330 [Alphaproteobacteria bacterium]|nr:hypothetical protein [Alphaproteobacteria bacterium]